MTDEGLRGTLELNLQSVMLSNRAAVRTFLTRGQGGVILNLSRHRPGARRQRGPERHRRTGPKT